MKVFRARYEDVLPLLHFCVKMHKVSGWDWIPMDKDVMRKNLVTVIRTQGMEALVAKDREGIIHGVLLASTDRMFFGKTTYATDIHFMARKGGLHLLRAFERWSVEQKAAVIIMSIATADPNKRIERFYEKAGFERIGTAFIKRLENTDVIHQESRQESLELR